MRGHELETDDSGLDLAEVVFNQIPFWWPKGARLRFLAQVAPLSSRVECLVRNDHLLQVVNALSKISFVVLVHQG